MMSSLNNPVDFKLIAQLARKSFPESIDAASRDADKILKHVFCLLGSGPRNLEAEIDWQRDFKSGFRWNLKAVSDLELIPLRDGADVKVPWELSRFHHLIALGKAYLYAGGKAQSARNEDREQEKYAREFVREIEDWIAQNPSGYGVNWACPMEAAIRVINWLWGYCFFVDSPLLHSGFLKEFRQSLISHGKYIYDNIEIYPGGITSNHTIFDYAGLFFLGLFLSGEDKASKWLKRGKKGLIKAMMKQTSSEGVDYEGSISYHRLAVEAFLTILIAGKRYSINFPGAYLNRLEKMLEFIMYYTKPDGSSPLIGDSDDGRLQIFSNYPHWNRLDHRDLLSTGAVIFNRPDFKAAAGKFYEESLWLLGNEGFKRFNSIPEVKNNLRSRAFSESGYYIMRQDDLYMIIDCLPDDATAPSGHRHNSRLSFELSASGTNFIIDPGSYVYTGNPGMRNLFRSTTYHNTVVIDQLEQNSFRANDLFSLRKRGTMLVHSWQRGGEADFLDVEYRYQRPWIKRLKHRRQFYFSKKDRYWLIRDQLFGRGQHRFGCFFHFSKDVKIKRAGQTLIASHQQTRSALHLFPLGDIELIPEISDGWISGGYGIKEKALIVAFRGNFKNTASFGFILYPDSPDRAEEDIIVKSKSQYRILKNRK